MNLSGGQLPPPRGEAPHQDLMPIAKGADPPNSPRPIARVISLPGIAKTTAPWHVSRVLAKLSATSRTDAVSRAHDADLL